MPWAARFAMAFDDLKPQSPRTAANSRVPEPANAYGEQALARSKAAAERCRTVLDVAFGDDDEQKLDLYLPDDAEVRDVPVLLYFHGGAWQHGYKEWNGFMAPVFVDLPAIFVSASYRLVPEHKFPAAQHDAFTALQWVWRNIAEHGGDPGRIFVAGWSVGGSLASLLALRRDLYPIYGLPADIVKACFAASAGFAYPSGDPAPGNSGITYGELMYERAADDVLTAQVNYAKGNRVPFYISHGSEDFRHVMNSSAAMVAALREEDCAVACDVFEGLDHYQTNLAHGERDDRWVATVRAWMTAPPSRLSRKAGAGSRSRR